MCGIVGYVGYRNSVNILLKGLKNLEYRGYDSAGIAVLNEGQVNVVKKKGKIQVLADEISNINLYGTIGIGHTRWATHGIPSDINAHPHGDCTGNYVVIHNGIIENYHELKQVLLEKHHRFLSQTDTEVIPHMLEDELGSTLEEKVMNVAKKLKGSFALVIMDRNSPDKIIAVRKESPMIVGLGENENFFASDIPAILEFTNKIYVLEDYEVAVLEQDKVRIFTVDGKPVQKEIFIANWNAEQISKKGFEDFMIKEIFEQPQAVRQTLSSLFDDEDHIQLPFSFTKEEIKDINRITIVACGTASYAGQIGEYILEKLTGIPTKVEVGSEYRYRNPIIDKHNLVIVLSQSGETADTLASMREALKNEGLVIGITNVRGSTVSRELSRVIHTHAGPEIAVASTKAYITQLIGLYVIGIHIAKEKRLLTEEEYKDKIALLKSIPEKISLIFNKVDKIKDIASKYYMFNNMFFIGRNIDYATSLEGSHKLKEISYIHAEAYEAGELKHGALALVSEDMPVICLATIKHVFEKMASNIQEVQARKAVVLVVRTEQIPQIENARDEIVIPDIEDLMLPLLSIIPLQLFAYYIAKFRGCDVDQPRNLAKSVTVE